MRLLRTIGREILGLFVDDGHFAVAILAWVGLVWASLAWRLLPRLGLPDAAGGPILFVGLAAILVGSAVRRSRR